MASSIQIKSVKAIELLDSRGFPTVEVELSAICPGSSEPLVATAMVPSGASTGEGEALELRDQNAKRFLGKGVLKAVENVNELIAPAILKRQFPTQALFDQTLLDLDGTPSKSKLGANSILACSLAFARLKAASDKLPLYQSLSKEFGSFGNTLPVPLMNIINGGKHADNGLAIQEFMIVPVGFDKFSEALRAGVEIFHRLKKILASSNLSTGVGDEGGFAPSFTGDNPHEQVLSVILQAIKDAGYSAGKDVFLALDCAASEFCNKDGSYQFEDKKMSSAQMIDLYARWTEVYPIISIEDGLSEHDWEGWIALTERLGKKCQLVGDDLFVTNPTYLKKGIESKAANAILIKLNQIGTLSETLKTMNMARENNYNCIVSHRSGETEDAFIADLAVATHAGQIKTGSASRTDRMAKYNQLLRIESALGKSAQFRGAQNYVSLKK